MAVKWLNVEMPLGGADQYTDAPHVLPGKMRELENVRFRRPPTNSKRYGYEVITTNLLDSASTYSTARRLIGHEHETVICDDRYLYVYGKTPNEWAQRGHLSQCFVERHPTWSEFTTTRHWDAAYNQNIWVAAYGVGATTTTNVVVIDTTTDTILSVQPLNVTTEYVRVIAVGNYIYILQGTSYTRIDVTSGSYEFAAMAGFTGVGTMQSYPFADACALGSTHIVIAYQDNVSGDITIHRIDVSNNTSDANASTAEDPVSTLAVHATSGEGVLVVWDTATPALRAWSLSTALVQVVAPGDVDTGDTYLRASIGRASSTQRVIVWGIDGASPNHDSTEYRMYALATGATGSTVTVPDVVPASKPFQFGSRVYGWVTYEGAAGRSGVTTVGGTEETFYLLEYTTSAAAVNDPAIWVSTAARGIAEGIDQTDVGGNPINFLPQVSHIGDSKYDCPVLIKNRFQFAGEADAPIITAHTRLERLRADFDEDGRLHMAAPWGGGLILAGGRPSWYDGNTCTELGFAWRPGYFELSATAAGILTTGFYTVALTYEWQDALGNIHRSAPSEFVEIELTGAGIDEITVDLDETLLSNKGSTAIPTVGTFAASRAFIYRSTVAASSGLASNLYRTGTATVQATGITAQRGTSTTLGSATADNDTELVLNDFLYTTGGILENAGIPPCKVVTRHIDRLWLGGLEEPDLVWFSQPYVSGEGPRFHEQLSLRMPASVTALASMDAKLVAFGEESITIVEGNGPPASGGIDTGFVIYEVPTDVGCIEPRSVVTYRDGVLFQSRKGIYRLGRDLSVTFVGAPIKGYSDTYGTITSAVDIPDRSEVIFGASRSAASARFVFNYEVEQWSLDTCPQKELSAAIVYNATTETYIYAYVATTDGVLHRETVGTYNDRDADGNPIFITSKWVTPWFRLNTVQDWLRVRGVTLLGTRPGGALSTGVRVRVGFNYEDTTWAETHTFTAAEVDAAMVNGRMQLEIQFGTQRCEAIRLEIIDTGPAEGGSAGIELQSLVFTGGFQAADRYRVDRETARK